MHRFSSGNLILGDTDPSGSGINIAGLLQGDYFLRLEAFVDPPFSIAIFGPPSQPLNIGALVVPEPTMLMLAATGLVAASRRRHSRKHAA